MIEQLRTELPCGMTAVIAHSTRADGDLSPSAVEPSTLAARRRQAVPGHWFALHQVHGRNVVRIEEATDRSTRPEADALVTTRTEAVLAVHSGDCVPVGFVHTAGAVAASHAGWRGLEAGVLEATVDALRSMKGDGDIHAVVGPHIRAASYEFGHEELDRLAARLHAPLRATTSSGTPALDLTAWTLAQLDALGVHVRAVSPSCTASEPDDFWSYRARREDGRIALTARLEPASGSVAS